MCTYMSDVVYNLWLCGLDPLAPSRASFQQALQWPCGMYRRYGKRSIHRNTVPEMSM
jgi:hypothetical protein